VNEKTEKPIKLRKPRKNNRKNRTVKKNRLKFWKNWPVRFDFISLKPNRTQTKKTRKKSSQNQAILKKSSQTKNNQVKTKPNRFESIFFLKNRTKLNQNRLVWTSFNFFFKFSFVTFFDINRTEMKIITPKKKHLALLNIYLSAMYKSIIYSLLSWYVSFLYEYLWFFFISLISLLD